MSGIYVSVQFDLARHHFWRHYGASEHNIHRIFACQLVSSAVFWIFQITIVHGHKPWPKQRSYIDRSDNDSDGDFDQNEKDDDKYNLYW